jgi:two-component system cell cycle response regulator DivK
VRSRASNVDVATLLRSDGERRVHATPDATSFAGDAAQRGEWTDWNDCFTSSPTCVTDQRQPTDLNEALTLHMPHKPSILVVDDAEDGREMLVEYLAFRGFQVAEARHGAEAIEVARRVQPHIILMDLSMPVLDGWEATRQLKADPLTKHIIIIAVTAHAFLPEQESARVAGCDAVIAKPFDLAVLASELDRVISQGLAAFDAPGVTARATPRKRSSKVRGS